ncbi:hypothetical protein ABZT47_39330 [Sphaerisporangium sp. NPDC005289]|uniref:hypothetical protein n=1 Tax=Sphaerisporangium sp. NPDC005289 TaxID=3155247 RepID=UPI0033A5923B
MLLARMAAGVHTPGVNPLRDVTFLEDTGQARAGRSPQETATCGNLAIAGLRHVRRLDMAHARRHGRNDPRRLPALFHP